MSDPLPPARLTPAHPHKVRLLSINLLTNLGRIPVLELRVSLSLPDVCVGMFFCVNCTSP